VARNGGPFLKILNDAVNGIGEQPYPANVCVMYGSVMSSNTMARFGVTVGGQATLCESVKILSFSK